MLKLSTLITNIEQFVIKNTLVCSLTFQIRLVAMLSWINLDTSSLRHNFDFKLTLKMRHHSIGASF